ncbi:RNA-splicing ligase RtcB [Adhaeribacter arboris]|uniref:3'-phosphate/5'-hydroxy nucleic acid ligase n=2 Tax=Adhaeribacter arboris TaxID=2072846 RepID=A0A2T2YPD6_9BACT|nr:RNA-splicing ligase RtcB [Adhaeribacter arboris]
MASKKLTGHDLMELGFPAGRSISLAISLMQKHYAHLSPAAQLDLLKQVLLAPDKFVTHTVLGEILAALTKQNNSTGAIHLHEQPKPYAIFGDNLIETDAKEQMDLAMRLPVTVNGALMPDTHKGHGLPIGGVLATDGAVIPYAVGMDIACRMHFTLYNVPATILEKQKYQLKQVLQDQTRFGVNTGFEKPQAHEVFDRPEFNQIKVLQQLKTRAAYQLGSSGTGNHFVEFGAVTLDTNDNAFNLPAGEYVGILSHSGARSLGKNIAAHYTQIAMDTCRLPVEAKYLAWLNLQTQAGQEYWQAMQVANDYALACHERIHERLSVSFGEEPVARFDNPHNFAWKEQCQGQEVIVHRKGAARATADNFNVIPGSMTQPGYLVRGLGNVAALYSSSHGAGRAMSAKKAAQVLYQTEMNGLIKAFGIELIGGSLQESPVAYKNMHYVMESQQQQVEILGKFTPKLVRMDR